MPIICFLDINDNKCNCKSGIIYHLHCNFPFYGSDNS